MTDGPDGRPAASNRRLPRKPGHDVQGFRKAAVHGTVITDWLA
jgi:hypothetical protein